ncbi:MAG: helix-turn-helix domain-containing protein [Nostoc sp.]|uniref:helix-turn-helix domain-containing protein n=1 Tax=Nostoc sp. TaxID=1180 RepID=UPI002FFA2734
MEAFRVYCHLCRRAGCDNNAFPSYKSIGEACFRGSFPGSSTETLRQKAIAAVSELVSWNLITKTPKTKPNGSVSSNQYQLTDIDEWFVFPTKQSSLIRGKNRNNSGEILGVVLGGNQGSNGGILGVVVGEYQDSSGGIPKVYPTKDYPIEVHPLKDAPLASPPAPPTPKSCVCEKEELDLTTKEIELKEPTPKLSTSLLKKSESLQQTDNPSCRPTIAAVSFDKNEQSNKLKKPKFQSIEDLIDMVLLDPSIMATDSLPAVYRTEIKMRNWRFPWRTSSRDKIYQTCDRRLVELIAKHRAKWSESESWQEKIPTVLKSIGNLESSKAGLEELMGYWSQIVEPEATSESTKQHKPDEKQLIGYFANRSLDWHKSTFSEFLDRVDEVGEDKARVSFSTRYDQQSPGATDKWLEWIKLTHPSMYLHLHSNAA